MTTQTLPALAPSFTDTLASWMRSIRIPRTKSQPATADETRARRDFICDMLDENTAALASETDIHTMMLVYPCRF